MMMMITSTPRDTHVEEISVFWCENLVGKKLGAYFAELLIQLRKNTCACKRRERKLQQTAPVLDSSSTPQTPLARPTVSHLLLLPVPVDTVHDNHHQQQCATPDEQIALVVSVHGAP